MTSFSTHDNSFVLNGEPVRIISGAIHYFRVVPEYWEDRLKKLKAFGANCVETYMPWNLHEPSPGTFSFDKMLDFERFIRTAESLGLYVILRPGPYICAEWEFGGLPAWLLRENDIKLRCSDPVYFAAVERYFAHILPRIVPLQCTQGGPVIMIQVENEYGAFGNDAAYMQSLRDLYTKHGIDIVLFTSDQPQPHMLRAGKTSGALMTANFGSNAKVRFERLRSMQPKGPLMNAEFWCGWFDQWNGPHSCRSAQSAAKSFDQALSLGGSVNFYMFHGGTNFGFTNGANCKDGKKYQPTITSYDYDALLSESGDITPKYIACRKILSKYISLAPLENFNSQKIAIRNIKFNEYAPLFLNLDMITKPVHSPSTITMEQAGQNFGYILYRTHINSPSKNAKLNIIDVHDRACVYVDGVYVGTVYRPDKKTILEFSISEGDHQLDILVENMGRTNYGPYLADKKGITSCVQLNDQTLFGWEIFPLALDNISSLRYSENTESAQNTPAFYRAHFSLESAEDTFLDTRSFGKGNAFINGFNLGRFWEKGPQKTLYIPAPLLKKGSNELVIFDIHKKATETETRRKPILGRKGLLIRIAYFLKMI